MAYTPDLWQEEAQKAARAAGFVPGDNPSIWRRGEPGKRQMLCITDTTFDLSGGITTLPALLQQPQAQQGLKLETAEHAVRLLMEQGARAGMVKGSDIEWFVLNVRPTIERVERLQGGA